MPAGSERGREALLRISAVVFAPDSRRPSLFFPFAFVRFYRTR